MAKGFAGLGAFRVHYENGETVDVRIISKAVVAAERRWPGRAVDGSDRYPPNEGLHYLVWVSLGEPEGDFDAWLDQGFVVESLDDEESPTRPIVGVA
jgi:hypothetical protein